MADSTEAPAQRPRLNLKPRDPEAAKKIDLERTASGKKVRGAREGARERRKRGKRPDHHFFGVVGLCVLYVVCVW
jgi:hypothetical protein